MAGEYYFTIGCWCEHQQRRKKNRYSYYWVASTLGSFITGKNITGRDDAMKHEFGHYIQSRKWGPLYLFVFVIPSVLSFALRRSKHEEFYTERNANEESSKWFGNI